jgi:hypothetical protein
LPADNTGKLPAPVPVTIVATPLTSVAVTLTPLPVIVTVPVGVGKSVGDPLAGTITVRVIGCPDAGDVGERVKLTGPVAAFVVASVVELALLRKLGSVLE